MRIEVHPRVMERHPELTMEDVRSAWQNAMVHMRRLGDDPIRYVAVGSDSNGRLIEMVAQIAGSGTLIIFHAMTPPSTKTLNELGIRRR